MRYSPRGGLVLACMTAVAGCSGTPAATPQTPVPRVAATSAAIVIASPAPAPFLNGSTVDTTGLSAHALNVRDVVISWIEKETAEKSRFAAVDTAGPNSAFIAVLEKRFEDRTASAGFVEGFADAFRSAFAGSVVAEPLEGHGTGSGVSIIEVSAVASGGPIRSSFGLRSDEAEPLVWVALFICPEDDVLGYAPDLLDFLLSIARPQF